MIESNKQTYIRQPKSDWCISTFQVRHNKKQPAKLWSSQVGSTYRTCMNHLPNMCIYISVLLCGMEFPRHVSSQMHLLICMICEQRVVFWTRLAKSRTISTTTCLHENNHEWSHIESGGTCIQSIAFFHKMKCHKITHAYSFSGCLKPDKDHKIDPMKFLLIMTLTNNTLD